MSKKFKSFFKKTPMSTNTTPAFARDPIIKNPFIEDTNIPEDTIILEKPAIFIDEVQAMDDLELSEENNIDVVMGEENIVIEAYPLPESRYLIKDRPLAPGEKKFDITAIDGEVIGYKILNKHGDIMGAHYYPNIEYYHVEKNSSNAFIYVPNLPEKERREILQESTQDFLTKNTLLQDNYRNTFVITEVVENWNEESGEITIKIRQLRSLSSTN